MYSRMTQAQPYDYSLIGDAHVALYEDTNGAEGYIWNGAPILVLTTKGAKSGETRKHPLIFGQDGDRYLIVASMGGAPKHPQWYRNLSANPHVELQVRDDKFAATARTASPDREGAPLADHDRGVAELRPVPGTHRPRHPSRRARTQVILASHGI